MVDRRLPFSGHVGRKGWKVSDDSDDLIVGTSSRIRVFSDVTKTQTKSLAVVQIHPREAAIDDNVGSADVADHEVAAGKNPHAIRVEQIDTRADDARDERVGDAHVRDVIRTIAQLHAFLEANPVAACKSGNPR